MVIAASQVKVVVDDDDGLVLPVVQPKSFTPIPSLTSSSSPTTTIRRRGGGGGNSEGGGRFSSPKSAASSSSPATPRAATKLGLSLRRITPAASSSVAATPSPYSSPRARSRRFGGGGGAIPKNHQNYYDNHGDGQQSTTGSSSLVSRITGRSKYSIATGATPVMRGGRAGSRNRNPLRGSGGNPPALKKKSVDQRQRMEDEYYRPSMHWEEEEEEDEEDDYEDEDDNNDYYYNEDAEVSMMDEGELPRLMMRVGAGSSRQYENPTSTKDETTRAGIDLPLPPSAATVAAATDAADMPPLVSPPADYEQLKVAGFWSQLDDNGSGDSSDEDDIPNANDDDDDEEMEEMPGDERQWRQSVSPPRNRKQNPSPRTASHHRDSHDNDNSIGLDLVGPRHDNGGGGGGGEEEYDGTATASKSLLQAKKSNNKYGSSGGGNNWNLLEKAACFANDSKVVDNEDEESGENTTSIGQQNKNRNDYMEEEDDDQSLDRTFQSSYTGAKTGRYTQNTAATAAKDDAEEENGVLACITGALATICGYEVAENIVSPNKKRAHDIIDKRKNSRSVSSKKTSNREEYGTYYDDETNMTDEEDAAIELQYHRFTNQEVAGTDDSGLALSPRRKLAFKKLLSLGKKKRKEMESPTRKTLVTTTTRSGKERSGVGGVSAGGGEGMSKSTTRITDLNSSLTFEQEILGITPGEEEEEEEGEKNNDDNEDVNIVSRPSTHRSHVMGHDEPKGDKTLTNNEGDSAKTEQTAIKPFIVSPTVVPNDDEELKSEAATWSTNKKNAYLRQLAERAKMEYAVNNAGGLTDSPSNDDKSNNGTMGVAVAAAAAIASSRVAQQDDIMANEPAPIPRQEVTGGEQASYNADYNTFSPAQKRLFLRLLNSGMSPQDAAQRLAQESGVDGEHATTEDAIKVDENDVDEEDEIIDDDEGNIDNGSDMPSFSKMPSLKYPDDESIPPLISADPDVLSGTGGDNDDLSIKNGGRENIHSVSRSEMAQDESRSNSQGRHAVLASIPLVPALIRAKLRSKSKERKTEYPTLLQQDDEIVDDANADDFDDDDALDEQTEGQQAQEAPALNNVGGLLSSGIGYYDAQDRGIDQNEDENDFDNDHADSGLLISESSPSTRGRSQKHKFLGAAVASGLAAKVAASSRQVSVPRKRGLRYRSVDNSLATPVTMAEIDSYIDDESPTIGAHDDQETEPIKSPRPVSSALHFMNRNPTKKPGSSKQWSKLDSDMSLDQVAPSRSVEVEDMPSWLLSHGDDEDVELKNETEGEDEIDSGQVAGGEDVPNTFVHSTVAEQIESRPPLWSPEMDQSQLRRVVTPSSPGSATSVNSPPDELTSEAAGAERQNGEETPFSPPVSPVTPDEDAISMMDRSLASSMVGSAWTSISKSHRKRHKGAASKRILQAKEAESQNKNKGWLDSIRDAASMHGQIWDPERGWVDYTEPEDYGGHEHDYFSPESLHIVIPVQARIKTVETNDNGEQHPPRQSTQAKTGASVLRSTDGLRGEIKSSGDTSVDGDDTIFDSMSLNSAVEGMSVYSNSTAAPKRRVAPRHRPTDRRKLAAEHHDKKPIGWKESMENATANVAGRHWDYEKGWVRADGTVDDDVSELTRSTLEGVNLSNHENISPDDAERNMALLRNQHVSRVIVREESTSRSHLLPVTEETDNASSTLIEEDENDYDLKVMDSGDRVAALIAIDPDDGLTDNIQPSEDVVLPSIATAGSDKENQTGITPTPLPSVDHRAQSLPMSNNPKRTLNQWLEKCKKDTLYELDESDVAAVVSHESMDSNFSNHLEDDEHQPLPTPFPVAEIPSHESMDSTSSNHIEDNEHEPLPTPFPLSEITSRESMDSTFSNRIEDDEHQPLPTPFAFSNIMDSFGEIEKGAQEVEVVKEKCTDADSDLFEPSNNGISTSLVNKLSEGVSASSQRKITPRQPVHERKPVIKQDFNENSSWRSPSPLASEGEQQLTSVTHNRLLADALQADEFDSSRVRSEWTHPQQAYVVTEESSNTELDSNAPQVNTAGSPVTGVGNAFSGSKVSGIQNLDPPKSRTSRTGTRIPKRASDSWILNREKEDEQVQGPAIDATATNSYVGNLRSKFESKGSDKSVVLTNNSQIEKPVFVPANNGGEENDVYFRSTAMGIRLKRGEDGFVRVVSVTEATNDSSIVRDGAIEPDDWIVEAAGVDLRNPISNNQWGETVTKIRNAPRPMKFVVAAGPKRDFSTKNSDSHQPPSIHPPPPAKYVMESRLSKSPEGQQVLESLSMARSYDVARAATPPSIQQLVNSSTQTSVGRADETVASRTVNDDETQIPPKESLLKRIAAGCTSPATVCTAPTSHHPSTSSQQSHGSSNEEESQVPMAHLQFLRTNPTIARVANAASRRYPALCGRPDTIFEEPDDDDDVTRDTMTTERSAPRDRRPTYGSTRKRSSSSKDDSAKTMATFSTYDDRTAPPIGATYSAGSGSIGSGGDNTEFLEKLGSSLRSRVRDRTNPAPSEKMGKASNGLSEYVARGSKYHQHVADDVEWPDDGQEQLEEHQAQKDTIHDGMFSCSSSMNRPSYLSSERKNGTARQAELLAAGKVENMMNELHNVDPEEECEI